MIRTVARKSTAPDSREPNARLSGFHDRMQVVSFWEVSMTLWKIAVAVVVVVCGNPLLDAVASEGTAKEQAACRPDVRRYCHSIKPGSDSGAYLSCLQTNRAKLSKACLAVLVSHGV